MLERPDNILVKKNMYRFLSVCLLAILICSCGVYTFNPRGKSTISSISIERFTNETSEYGLEDRMSDQIIDAFIADGNIKIVSPENAEATLSGALVRYERKPFNPDINDQVEKYQVTMYFKIKLVNNADGVEIWNDQIHQNGEYNLETETEEDAQLIALGHLVDEIINRTTKNW